MIIPEEKVASINLLLSRYGVRFGIYKNGEFKEQLFPFDAIPRIIGRQDFDMLEKGLIQRVDALNLFLKDIYTNKSIIQDGIIPEEFIFTSSGYLAECENILPHLDIYSHISGIDLVQGKDGDWYVLEDNLRVPSGASYPLIARKLSRIVSPETFTQHHIIDNRNYSKLLKQAMDDVNYGGLNVILTPGRYNSAYFEHSYLAEETHSVLATSKDLFVENSILYYKSFGGNKKVGTLYKRVSDEYLDPMTFRTASLIGVSNIMDVYRKGRVAMVNAPGCGIADDKGIYFFVPKMIEYYLGEKPILKNAPTYLPYFEDEREFVLSNPEKLVIKDVAEAGGYGVVFGRDLSPEELMKLEDAIKREPRRFIAQEIIDFKGLPVMIDGQVVERKADLRAFVIKGAKTRVWASGLTRFTKNPESFIVNSSQGGGFKDTWVLSR